MEVIRVTEPLLSRRQLAQVIACMRAGGTVVYPTETSYGLGGVYRPAVVRRIGAIKNRPAEKLLPAIVASQSMARRFLKQWPRWAQRLAATHWPGPLTIALGSRLPAVRRSSHPIAQQLVRALGHPLVSTSANVSGRPSLFTATAIATEFRKQKSRPDIIIDCGRLPQRPASTIVGHDGRRLVVYRQGEVRVERRK